MRSASGQELPVLGMNTVYIRESDTKHSCFISLQSLQWLQRREWLDRATSLLENGVTAFRTFQSAQIVSTAVARQVWRCEGLKLDRPSACYART